MATQPLPAMDVNTAVPSTSRFQSSRRFPIFDGVISELTNFLSMRKKEEEILDEAAEQDVRNFIQLFKHIFYFILI